MNFITKKHIDRRHFLKAAGVMLTLPYLEAMDPALKKSSSAPMRMVGIETNLGIYPQSFFPKDSGRDYTLSPYLSEIKEFRNDFTVFSGLSHGEVGGGHASEITFLTGAPHPESASFKNTISLDQVAADSIGPQTRFPSLPLNISKGGNKSLSWTRNGVMIPAERDITKVFRKLFMQGKPEDIKKEVRNLQSGRSILDAVGERSKSLNKSLSKADKERLEQYYTSVRELEKRMHKSQDWAVKPKPKVSAQEPKNEEYLIDRMDAMFELIHLAFENDSTRLISLMMVIDGVMSHVKGVSSENHDLSHHTGRKQKIAELNKVEAAQLQSLGRFLKRLKESKVKDSNLLDSTMVLYGSNLGNGNNHITKNLPILLAGGGFKHGQHLAFDTKRNSPLSNLFVSMLQKLGVEEDKFASSTGTLTGLV